MPVSLRPAGPSDAPTLHRLILELADYERLLEEALAHSSAEALAAHLAPDAEPRVEAFLAETETGEPAGFALCYRHYSTFRTGWGLYLEDLYVRPDFRGQGVGLLLLRAVARLAVARGAARLEWQVLDWNDLANTFYDQLGAEAMTEWTTRRLTGPALLRLADVPEDAQPSEPGNPVAVPS